MCGLKWAWEQHVPGLKTSVFVVPGNQVKNGDARLIVLNSIAKSVVEDSRGIHPEYVFTYASAKGTRDRVGKINNSSWKNAREQAADRWTETTTESAAWGFRHLRVHDLKHTFGRRLRAAGVSFEDRQDLLGHRSHRITTDYSQAELGNLMAAAEKVCASGSRKSPALVILRQGRSGQTVRNY